MKEQITSRKKTIQSQKNNVTVKYRRLLVLFYLLWISFFRQINFFFFLSLINYLIISINAIKLKPSRPKKVNLLTQVLINGIIEVSILVFMSKKKLWKIYYGTEYNK